MNGTPITQDVLTETYTDYHKLICMLSWKFVTRYYKGNPTMFDSIKSDAEYYFVTSLYKYNKQSGSLTTWLSFKIWFELLDKMYRTRRHYAKHQSDKPIDQPITARNNHTNLIDIMNSCTSDCKYILEIVTTPTFIKTITAIHGNGKHRAKETIEKHLASDLGWTKRRIKDTFCEIQHILTEQ